MPWSAIVAAAILRAVKNPPASPVAKPKRATSFEPAVAIAVGMAIRSTREDKGHAQDGLALLAGVDRSYYGKLERGERQPSVGLLLRIAYALEVSGSDLLKRAEIYLADQARAAAPRRPPRKPAATKSSSPASRSAPKSRGR